MIDEILRPFRRFLIALPPLEKRKERLKVALFVLFSWGHCRKRSSGSFGESAKNVTRLDGAR